MFTGIVQGLCPANFVQFDKEILKLGVQLDSNLIKGAVIGCSIAIDGICLTVTAIKDNTVYFDVIPETLSKTTLDRIQIGNLVNVERSARIGDEIGGHLVSGHVWGKAQIIHIDEKDNHRVVTFAVPSEWSKYLFPKGFIAIDGASLTLVDVIKNGEFTIHLIPETLRRTTLGQKKAGDLVNIEFETNTQLVVSTAERLLKGRE